MPIRLLSICAPELLLTQEDRGGSEGGAAGSAVVFNHGWRSVVLDHNIIVAWEAWHAIDWEHAGRCWDAVELGHVLPLTHQHIPIGDIGRGGVIRRCQRTLLKVVPGPALR